MLKGFKDFILRGNVIELAVGVIIGAAFTSIVTALTEHLIEPLINAMGGAEVTGLGFRIISDNPSTYMDFAAVITAIINFLLVAAVVYFAIVVPMNKLHAVIEKKTGDKDADDSVDETTEKELLEDIRDLLAQQQDS
ncbi:MAG: large conductance mechanosensitive channel protein MscL [Lawsonella sp.]